MRRPIDVSTDVFAAIWANRKDGEDTEDAILRRIIGCPAVKRESAPEAKAHLDGGFIDARNGVKFPVGFEIFRNYKRREYAAQAQNGAWVREDTGERYASLNQLNASITAGNENVWNGNWKYRAPDGSIKSIANLRT